MIIFFIVLLEYFISESTLAIALYYKEKYKLDEEEFEKIKNVLVTAE